MTVTTRGTLRGFLVDELRGAVEVDLDDLVAKAHARFDADNEFRNDLFRQALGALVADELRHLMTHTRYDAQALNERAKEIAATIFETVGAKRRKSLTAMVRPELLYAHDERAKQIDGMSRFNSLLERLAGGLPNDRVTVGDHYSDDAFQRIWNAQMNRDPGTSG